MGRRLLVESSPISHQWRELFSVTNCPITKCSRNKRETATSAFKSICRCDCYTSGLSSPPWRLFICGSKSAGQWHEIPCTAEKGPWTRIQLVISPAEENVKKSYVFHVLSIVVPAWLGVLAVTLYTKKMQINWLKCEILLLIIIFRHSLLFNLLCHNCFVAMYYCNILRTPR